MGLEDADVAFTNQQPVQLGLIKVGLCFQQPVHLGLIKVGVHVCFCLDWLFVCVDVWSKFCYLP